VKCGSQEENGVKYYCIVDADDKSIDVFMLENGKYKNINSANSGKINFDLEKCNFEFDYTNIWD
jgi:Uma2 family endonuclease